MRTCRCCPSVVRATLVDRNLATQLSEFVKRPFLTDTRSLETAVEIHVQLGDGVLQVVAPRRRLFSSTTYLVILWMVGSSLALFAIAVLFMRNQVRPIRQLAGAAEAFGKGRDSAAFRIVGASEVRQAAAAFNQMRDRIRRQIAQRTEMLAGVSHDLRTPLTRMKLALAMLGDGADTADLKADVAEMEKMLGGYLAFARGEGREPPGRDRPQGAAAGGRQRRRPRGRPHRAGRRATGWLLTAAARRHAPLPRQPRRQRPALRPLGRDRRRRTAATASRSPSTTTARASRPTSARTCSARSSASIPRATRRPAASASASPSPATSPAATAASSSCWTSPQGGLRARLWLPA